MHKSILSICVVAFSLLVVTSCSSHKEQTTKPPQPEAAAGEEKDRGFDPCLVNDKLKACKKKSG